MRILVVTIVHHPLDARIHARQVRSLRDAGWHVTYAAPWSATDTDRPDELATIDLPRAEGRRRLAAIRAARRAVRAHADDHDLVLVHDPDLLPALRWLGSRLVWDVHEDTSAALIDRPWVPAAARPLVGAFIRRLERSAERRHRLLLAEDDYQARFLGAHTVVRNLPWVPSSCPPADRTEHRVTYVGRLSRFRGAHAMVALGEQLQPDVAVELIGPADPDVEDLLTSAAADGTIRWTPRLPNEEAMARLAGSLAGLALLDDLPNYRSSLPTKVAEYLAHGVPPVVTPLPRAVELVEGARSGSVVPFDDPGRAEDVIRQLAEDPVARRTAGEAAWRYARARLDWRSEATQFVDVLNRWATAPTDGPPGTGHPAR